jgi:hypothetical protein
LDIATIKQRQQLVLRMDYLEAVIRKPATP